MLRIGELSRRVGVSEHLLRAWENRYGLLRPERTAGGFRLYSDADERRVRRMQAHLGDGMSAAQAARRALDDEPVRSPAESGREVATSPVSPVSAKQLQANLRLALDDFDEPAAQAVIDRMLADLSIPAALRDVVLPFLSELGERWARGEVSVAQEHFASYIVRGRLAGLSRGWGAGRGPLAVLACPPDELHDLALLCFGIVLHASGWRVNYLGAATPFDHLAHTVEELRPDLVVVAATMSGTLEPARAELAALARRTPLAIAGAGATPRFADAIGARMLEDDPVTEAQRIA